MTGYTNNQDDCLSQVFDRCATVPTNNIDVWNKTTLESLKYNTLSLIS